MFITPLQWSSKANRKLLFIFYKEYFLSFIQKKILRIIFKTNLNGKDRTILFFLTCWFYLVHFNGVVKNNLVLKISNRGFVNFIYNLSKNSSFFDSKIADLTSGFLKIFVWAKKVQQRRIFVQFVYEIHNTNDRLNG
ncbi:hypothetical protein BpHYR1_037904 [Brachionus plicatilis]|uniref:Uncharacterized protein n=1 Tax=Brachionus plicatilis TaxID=10195 RepID=A0A3M7RTA3_BRAPC|nr:hypothetical protein BpHYR1_037904 [Brachionus plicatilis]